MPQTVDPCLWFIRGSCISPSYDLASASHHVCGAIGDDALVLSGYNHVQSFVGCDWRVTSHGIGAEYLILDAKQATCGEIWEFPFKNCIPNLISPPISRQDRWVGTEHKSTATYGEN